MKPFFLLLLQILILSGGVLTVQAEGETEISLDFAEEYLDLEEVQQELEELTETESFSFTETVKALVRGELLFRPGEMIGWAADLFFLEVRQMKQTALQILIVVLASSVFSHFITVFRSSQIADIGFYAMYLLISALLVKSFSVMSRLVAETCEALQSFMKVLLPSYLVTVVFSSGTVSALGFYELTVLAMNLLQMFLVKAALPAVHFYMILLILNQLAAEDYLSRMASVVETAVCWMVRTVLGIVLGLQAVQCLVAPAVDSLKNTSFHQLVKAIPGVGSLLDAAAETVAGSAVVIKNAVGVAGILGLLFLCLTPLLKLAACILIFRVLCAAVQPVADRRMVDGIESISRGAGLLLRILLAGLCIFTVSLAMITAAVKGGGV